MNTDTFQSFSDEFASSSFTDSNANTDTSTRSSDMYSEGYTFSTDDGDKNQYLPVSLPKIEKPKSDIRAKSEESSKLTVYKVLVAIDSAVDAIVDVIMPIEETIIIADNDLVELPSKSTKRKSPFVFRRKSANNGSPDINSSLSSKNQEQMSNAQTFPDMNRDGEPPKDYTSSLSPAYRVIHVQSKERNRTLKKPKSPKRFMNAESIPDEESREAPDPTDNPSTFATFLSSPRNKKIDKDDTTVETVTTTSEKSPIRARKLTPRKFFSSPRSKNAKKEAEASATVEDSVKEKDDEHAAFFFPTFDWITLTKEEKEEPKPEPEPEPVEEPSTKNKKLFGRRRNKKITKASDVTETADVISSVDQRDATEDERSSSNPSKKKGWRRGPFSPRGTSKRESNNIREAEIEQHEEELVKTDADEDWWSQYFWANQDNTNNVVDEGDIAKSEPELSETTEIKPKEGGRKGFFRRSKKNKSEPVLVQ